MDLFYEKMLLRAGRKDRVFAMNNDANSFGAHSSRTARLR